MNKQDLPRRLALPETNRPVISCSARVPESLRPVKDYLLRFTAVSDRMAVTQPRHLDALNRAAEFLESALETVKTMTPDMAATGLMSAQSALGEITGDQVDEALLDPSIATDAEALGAISEDKEALESALNEAYEAWESAVSL